AVYRLGQQTAEGAAVEFRVDGIETHGDAQQGPQEIEKYGKRGKRAVRRGKQLQKEERCVASRSGGFGCANAVKRCVQRAKTGKSDQRQQDDEAPAADMVRHLFADDHPKRMFWPGCQWAMGSTGKQLDH